MSDNPTEGLIDRAQVPELEVILLQQQLNARVRAGTLSGPQLAENGKLDEKTRVKQREMEAFDGIALAKIAPQRPEGAAAQTAERAEDERVLAFVKAEFAFISDTPYLDQDHKGPTGERIRKLEATFRRKWEAAGRAAEAIGAALREPIRPGSLLLADGSFAYDLLNHALGQLRTAETALATVPESDADRPELEAKVVAYRVCLVDGLRTGFARPKAPPAPPAEPAPPPPVVSPSRPLPAAPPPRAPATAELMPLPDPVPGWLPDPEREREGRRLENVGGEERARQLADLPVAPGDPQAAMLAASIARTNPEVFSPAMAERLDPYAMQELARSPEQLAKVPPKSRLAILKAYAAREGAEPGDAVAEAVFAGVVAGGLLAQHPQAAAEVLMNTPGALKPALLLPMLAAMRDDEVAKLPKEVLHALYKEIQAGGSPDDRRHLARLVRLMNKR